MCWVLHWIAGTLFLFRGQEGGQRAGTKNVPYIVFVGQVAELLTSDEMFRDNADRMKRMRSQILNRLVMRLSLSPVLGAIGVPTDY